MCEMGMGIHTTWVIATTTVLATSLGTLVKTLFLVNVNTDVSLVSLYKLYLCKWPFLALSTQDPDLVSKCQQ